MLQLSFVKFKKDSYLLIEGKDQNDRFYIIQTGKVRCFKANDPNNVSLKNLGTGDFVGVIPCMTGHLQIESAVAMTDVTCISVRKDQYPALIEKNIPVALKIIRTFANRMRTMNEQLTQLTLNNVSSDTPEHIFDVAKYYDTNGSSDVATYAYYRYLKECPKGANVPVAQKRFIALKPTSNAVYYEPTEELVRKYPKDTMIMSESQGGHDMFVIQEGQVSISKVVNGNEVILAVLKRGDMFGEMALLENKPRSASAIAHEDCRLMVINQKNFDQMVSTQPQLISRLTVTLAERLWSMYRQLDNASIQNPLNKMIDMLALQMEKQKKFTGPEQTDLTPNELANMCGIPLKNQPAAIYQFQQEKIIKMVNSKIFVSDCLELSKQAAFFRKQK
ncbi:MAG: cyclic nucleotide-binding domain-containing protein [Treponema sp.]|nr:cyclic nucleotide-binding domain-containing protein [Treponema sp.]